MENYNNSNLENEDKLDINYNGNQEKEHSINNENYNDNYSCEGDCKF